MRSKETIREGKVCVLSVCLVCGIFVKRQKEHINSWVKGWDEKYSNNLQANKVGEKNAAFEDFNWLDYDCFIKLYNFGNMCVTKSNFTYDKSHTLYIMCREIIACHQPKSCLWQNE